MKTNIALPLILSASASLMVACVDTGKNDDGTQEKSRTVQGTIDGFGSVIVDGVHYDSTNTTIEIDDSAGDESQLRVGQVVTVVGSDDGAEGTASQIIYDADIKGSITAIDLNLGQLEVMGQMVIINDMTVISDIDLTTLQVGDLIELSGYRDSTGQLVATFIEAETDNESEVKGTISALDTANLTFTIHGLTIDYSSTASLELDEASLRDGMLVEVEGTFNNGVLVADKIEQEDIKRDESDDSEMEVSGYIASLDLDNGLMMVGNTVVSFNESTEFEDGNIDQLALNVFVEAEGTFNSENELVAEEIEFEQTISLKLEGPVTAVTTSTVSVMGLEASVDTGTRIKDERDGLKYFNIGDIQVGDHVETKLTLKDDGSYYALRLERDESEGKVEIEGPIDEVSPDGNSITIATISIDATQFAGADILTVGNHVEVEGTFDGSVVVATDIEQDD